MKVRDALQTYLKAYPFGETPGGYEDRWTKFYAGKFPLSFPNIESRRKAIRLHDINHIITGYQPVVLKGEAQIAFFELASGCGKYWFGWFINSFLLPLILIWPKECWNAAVRGWKTKKSLYNDFATYEEYIDRDVEALRLEIGV